MLGIFLIICLAVFLLIELKAYRLLKDNYNEPVEIDSNERTYEVCYRAVVLHVVSSMVMLLGYMGCVWPYLFIEGIDRSTYIYGIAMFGLMPVLIIAYFCYLVFRNARGYIKISTDEIEYQRHKGFTINIRDIKKISYPGMCCYRIHLKEKGKKPLDINLNGFYKKKEICSLMKQLRDYSAKVSGRDRSLAHKLNPWRLGMILNRYYLALCVIVTVLLLFYTSYCCIDYDFFKKDYTAQFNAMGAALGQTENAWHHYVQAAVNYTELEDDFQRLLENSSKSGQLDLTDDQDDELQKWFHENASSWASLKEAVSINYCNATYEHISLFDSTDWNDFSHPSDSGYNQIRRLYSNADTGRLAGVLDLDWFDVFQMQITSSKHFVNGKSFIDQLVGYAMLQRSIKLLAKQDRYELEDLQKARQMLKEHFPAGLPSLSIEGEILIYCSAYDDMINLPGKFPVQTPLNPMFF